MDNIDLLQDYAPDGYRNLVATVGGPADTEQATYEKVANAAPTALAHLVKHARQQRRLLKRLAKPVDLTRLAAIEEMIRMYQAKVKALEEERRKMVELIRMQESGQ